MIRKSKSAYDCLIKIPLIIKLSKTNQLKNSDGNFIEDIYPIVR